MLAKAVGAFQQRQAVAFELKVVVVRHAVEAVDEMTVGEQASAEMKTDEPCRSGDEDAHRLFLDGGLDAKTGIHFSRPPMRRVRYARA